MKSTYSFLVALAVVVCAGLDSAYATITTYKNAVLAEPGLISYYAFDSGDIHDAKSSYNGTTVGNARFDAGPGGGTNKALVLPGKSHVNLGQIDAFDFASGQGTIEAWIRADWKGSPGYNPAIFADRDNGPVNWSIHMNAGKDAAGLWNGSSYSPLSFPLAGTNWHHLAVVFDIDNQTSDSFFTLYWDGAALGTTHQALGNAPESPTQIGSASESGQEEWIGALDEVAFYSTALSPEAIKAHYTAYLVGDPPTVLTQPQGGTFLAGIALKLSVEAKGADLNYQWLKDGSPVTGGTQANLTLTPLASSHLGNYQVIVANAAGRATSAVAQVQLGELPPKLKRYQAAVRGESSLISYYTFDGVDANDSAGSHPGTPQGKIQFGPGNGGDAGKALILNGAGHVNLGVVEAFSFASGRGTVEAWIQAGWTSALGYNPAIFANRNGNPVVWSIHMNDAKDAAGLWNGSSYQPLLTPGTGTSWHHLAVVFNTDNTSGETSFTLYWDGVATGSTLQGLGVPDTALPIELGSSAAAGQERWVGALDEVAFYGDALSAATIQAHYAAFITGNPPVITQQPKGGSYFAGDPVVLRLGAQGLGLTYQWLKNGSALAGATNAEFSISSLSSAEAGSYRARVSNLAGTVDSDEVVLRTIVPNLAAYQTAVRGETSLVSYYTFDSSDASDSKSSHHGAAVDGVDYQTGVGGGTDKTLLLDGNGHIDLGQVTDFDFASGLGTVEAWVRADWTSGPGYNPAIFADRDGDPVNWSIHLNAGKEAGGLWNGSAYQPLPTGGAGASWHHLAVVFDQDTSTGGSLFSLYWDGSLLGTTHQVLGSAPDMPTELGSASKVGQERWIGALDEIAFYRAALSEDAVRRHYLALIGAPVSKPSLTIRRSGAQVVLSWPAEVSGFILEMTPSLSAATWAPVNGVANNSVTLTATSQALYFRLRQ